MCAFDNRFFKSLRYTRTSYTASPATQQINFFMPTGFRIPNRSRYLRTPRPSSLSAIKLVGRSEVELQHAGTTYSRYLRNVFKHLYNILNLCLPLTIMVLVPVQTSELISRLSLIIMSILIWLLIYIVVGFEECRIYNDSGVSRNFSTLWP